MRTHDNTTGKIALHHLRSKLIVRSSESSWTEALKSMWPSPFCVVLVREAEQGLCYVATYINSSGEHLHYQADTPQEAVEGMREQFQAYIEVHPSEMPARTMMYLKRRLHSERIDMVRLNDRWLRLMDHLGRHEDGRDRRAAMGDFLDTHAPNLPSRIRAAALRRIEDIPSLKSRLSAQTRANFARAFDMFRMQQEVAS